jgi:hypothetical protein
MYERTLMKGKKGVENIVLGGPWDIHRKFR